MCPIHNKQKHVIIIDGMISAGKSSVLKALKEKCPQIKYIEEPYKDFQRELEDFYKNPNQQTCYRLQSKIYDLYLSILMYIRHENDTLFIIERSPINCNIFIEQNSHLLSKEQIDKLTNDFQILEDLLYEKHDVHRLYLKCDYDTILKRNRNRPYDNTIDEDYLKNLLQIYDEFIDNDDTVYVIDNNKNIDETIDSIIAYLFHNVLTQNIF